jgi:ATP-dependent DNA helicase RecG
MDADEILQAVNAGEDSDWEFKSAKGGFPRSLWETYSAMANTDGGVIVLGVEPKGDNQGEIRDGLTDPDKMRKTFWDNVHNRQLINTCLVTDKEVTVEQVLGKSVLVVRVPRADRRQRPVFTGLNPLTGTYRRNFEGDYLCRPEEVGRLLADQAPDPADARVLSRFGIADLHTESISQYQHRFSARNPFHA